MNKEKLFKYGSYVACLAIILGALFYIKGCHSLNEESNRQSKIKSMADQHLIEMYNRKVAEVHNLKGEKDRMKKDMIGIKASELKAVHHYHTVYADAMKNAPDTCEGYLQAVNKAHEQSDSTKDAHIYKSDSTNAVNDLLIQNYEDIASIKDFYYAQRGDTIQELKVELKQTNKKRKNEKVLGTLEKIGLSILGFFTGLGIGKL
jgi:hypothetical protein